MVIHCSNLYFNETNDVSSGKKIDYQNKYFDAYYKNFSLSEFQKWGIKSIVDRDD